MHSPSELLGELGKPEINVQGLLTVANSYLNKKEIVDFDFYKSLDYYCSASLPDIFRHDPTVINYIPPIHGSPSSSSGNTQDYGYLLDYFSHRDTLINHPVQLSHWIGSNVSIFYNPVMIGFYSDHSLDYLGWGSSKVASYIAYLNRDSEPILHGRICVVLTRHQSKYAHFVRDRLTKIIWAQFYSGHGPYDHFVFDFPLNNAEINFLTSIGIRYSFLSAYDRKTFTLSGDIMIIKCSSGMSLLPYLKDFVLNYFQQLTPAKSSHIFLSRGKSGSRRNAINIADVERVFVKFGFSIINPSEFTLQQQLSLCIDSTIVAGFHGAQLINSLTSSSLIELHSYPYAFSPWSQTMRLMSQTLKMGYVPLLIGFDPQQSILNSESTIHQLRDNLTSINSSPKIGQESSFFVDLNTLRSMIRSSLCLLD